MISEKTKRYLTITLGGAPRVLKSLLSNAALEDFDKVVDPSRFTLREMLAHLGDWEAIHLGRLVQFRDEVQPTIQGIDEGQWAIEHDHASVDPKKSFDDYMTGRQDIIDFIGTLTDKDWNNTGFHTEAGEITLAEYIILIAAHDGYHHLQTVDWLERLHAVG